MFNNLLVHKFSCCFGALVFSTLVGCGAPPAYPAGDNRTVVISGGTTTSFDNPVGTSCLTLSNGTCIRPQDTCGVGAHAEVITSADGMVQNIVCYPNKVDSYSVVDQQVSTAIGNKGLIVLDGAVDGPDIIGDLSITDNNAIVYGQGPTASVIGGNLAVSFNNTTLRGLSVLGNTTLTGNTTVLYYCVIVGNITIASNDNILSGCDVYGNVTVTGNNNQLLDVRIQGTLSNSGKNNVCRADYRFTDANNNQVIEATELGAVLTCG